jgi:hypothetical protein
MKNSLGAAIGAALAASLAVAATSEARASDFQFPSAKRPPHSPGAGGTRRIAGLLCTSRATCSTQAAQLEGPWIES